MLQKKKGLNPRTKGCQGCGKPSAAHMCVSEKQFKIAPKGQRLHGIGRPTAAASIHVCAAKYINSGLHLQVSRVTIVWQISCCCENTHVTCVLQKKPTQGWFGRPHPEERTHMCAAKFQSFEGCTQGQGLQLQGFG